MVASLLQALILFLPITSNDPFLLLLIACGCAKSFQSCLTLCHPMDHSLSDSSVHGILQARSGVGCHALLQGIFPTRDQTRVSYVSCIGRHVLYH